MPFKDTCQMEERIRMLSDYETGNWSVSELCRRYGVCRDTFYEWRKRRAVGEEDWFVERSHIALSCPHRTPSAVVEAVVSLRRRFVHFGARKILAVLEREAPEVNWPAASTIGDILKRAGLVTSAKRRRKALDPRQRPFLPIAAPNEEWSTDFKGWFRTQDQQRIDPLTITDTHSRFLIDVQITAESVEGVRPVFERAFRTYGLPLSIRSDNGTPFASNGAGGLTRLSAWWLKLGIEPHLIPPACPQDNGRHERMHRTLKKQTTLPPAKDAQEQQARFDDFRTHYNQERPHQALGQRPPGELYTASLRPMPDRLEDPWYDADHQIRRVRSSGEIKWKNSYLFVSAALVGELVGIAELESGDHVVRFCDLDVGIINHQLSFRRFAPPRTGLRKTAEQRSKLSGIVPV
jgi:transposase InsO family protein